MTKNDLAAATALATRCLALVAAAKAGQAAGQSGAQLAYLTGLLTANAASELAAGTFWADFAKCFEAARAAGATIVQMETIRVAMAAAQPTTPVAVAVQNFAIRLALVEEAQILAATVFVSRADADAALAAISPAFDAAIETAANNFDQVAYQALVALEGAVATDLSTRAFALPTIVNYGFARNLPALWIAQSLYQDASRADELVAENDVVHPLFMPRQIEALSS